MLDVFKELDVQTKSLIGINTDKVIDSNFGHYMSWFFYSIIGSIEFQTWSCGHHYFYAWCSITIITSR